MRHIQTYIVSRHLATRDTNKILRISPLHISSSEEILPPFTRRSLAQPRTNKSPFLKSYLHNVDAKSHPLSLCLFCNTYIHSTHHLYAPHCHHWMFGQTPPDLRHCRPDARGSWLVQHKHKREDQTPSTSKG